MCKYKNPICHTCHMFKYKILYRNVTCANTKILYWNVTCANIKSDIEMSHVQIQKSHMSHMSHAIRHLLRYLVAYNLSRLHTVNMSSAICQLVMNTFVSAQPLVSQWWQLWTNSFGRESGRAHDLVLRYLMEENKYNFFLFSK